MSMRVIKARETILDDLLHLLIKRWGYPKVSARLEVLKGRDPGPGAVASNGYSEPRRHRLSAHEYVERIDIPNEKKDVLLKLARKFEAREFLPTIGHVKEFLEQRNIHTDTLYRRDSAIPKIVEILSSMPDEKLEAILHDENYSGPSRLGPLSDAIKARGTAIRSSR